jgi:hypothetical protein
MAWQPIVKAWHDTGVDYCDVCGNLLVRRYWAFSADGRDFRACREDDERLYARLKRAREQEGGRRPQYGET